MSHAILPLTLQVYAFSPSSQLCIRKQKITTVTVQRRYNVTTVLHSVNALKNCHVPTNHVHADYNFALPDTLSQITFQGQGPNCATGAIKRASLRNRVHTVLVDYPAERSPSYINVLFSHSHHEQNPRRNTGNTFSYKSTSHPD